MPPPTGKPTEILLPYTERPALQPNMSTFGLLFNHTATLYPDREAFYQRSIGDDGQYGAFSGMTYAEVQNLVRNYSRGLSELGVKPGDRVGILSGTRQAWILTDISVLSIGGVVVPLYDTLTDSDLAYIAKNSGVSTLVVSASVLHRLPAVMQGGDNICRVIVTDDIRSDSNWINLYSDSLPVPSLPPIPLCPEGTPKSRVSRYALVKAPEICEETAACLRQNKSTVRYELLSTVINIGAQTQLPEDSSYVLEHNPDALASIIYTSGSTGSPKGACISHRSFITDCLAASSVVCAVDPQFDWKTLCYLPLAHVLERQNEWTAIAMGGQLFFFTGALANFSWDCREASPTFLPVVPRILERIYRNIHSTISKAPAPVRLLFRIACNIQRSRLEKRIGRSKLLDRLVFHKVQEQLGGRLTVIASGSAPLDKEIGDFVELATGALVTEGYGATETSCLTFAAPFSMKDWCTVGMPMHGVHAKLISLPDLGYTVDDAEPAGELCLKGDMLFSGYYHDEAATRQVFDDDGWFHTSDIVRLVQPHGNMRIVDRVGAVFKLAQGEYVVASRIEAALTTVPFIAQACVYGSSKESFLIATIQLDMEEVTSAFPSLPYQGAVLASRPEVQEALLAAVLQAGRNSDLKGYEIPRYFILSPQLWTAEGGFVTPSFKIRRKVIQQFFQKQYERIYAHAHALTGKELVVADEVAREAPRIKMHRAKHNMEYGFIVTCDLP